MPSEWCARSLTASPCRCDAAPHFISVMKSTREGKRFLLATALLGVAAYNTGNNLIYLILALMLSIIFIAAGSLYLNLRGLSVSARLAGPVFAGQEADMEISVANRKRHLPSYSLRVKLPEGMRGEVMVPRADASSTARTYCPVQFERRGVFKWGDFTVESSFPFIFLNRKVRGSVSGTVTVYPRLIDVDRIDLSVGEGGMPRTLRPGRGEELLSLREFREGDDIKHISWKASAKTRRLMVREHARERALSVNIVLDDAGPPDAEAFERVVSYAVSLAARLIDEGFYVGLWTSAKRLPYGAGPEHLYRMLDVLAVARESDLVPDAFAEDDSGATLLVLKSPASPLMAAGADMVVYAA